MKASEILNGKRILIVEDEAIIALGLVELCDGLDCPSAVAANVERALELLSREAFGAAILDVNLGGVIATAVAAELCRRDIPFVVTTGYESIDLPPECNDPPIVPKPYVPSDIEAALLDAIMSINADQDLRRA